MPDPPPPPIPAIWRARTYTYIHDIMHEQFALPIDTPPYSKIPEDLILK